MAFKALKKPVQTESTFQATPIAPLPCEAPHGASTGQQSLSQLREQETGFYMDGSAMDDDFEEDFYRPDWAYLMDHLRSI
jgi:hypothetical protein